MGRKPLGDKPLTTAERSAKLRRSKAEACERKTEELEQLREAESAIKTFDARLKEMHNRIDAVLARLDKEEK